MKRNYVALLLSVLCCSEAQTQTSPQNSFVLHAKQKEQRSKRHAAGQNTHVGSSTHRLSNGVQVEWVKEYASRLLPSEDFAKGIMLDSFGNIYVVGAGQNPPHQQDILIFKYDSSGKNIWASRFNGQASGMDGVEDFCLDRHGNIYVTGWSTRVMGGRDFVTVKYNSQGIESWVVLYHLGVASWNLARAIAVDEDSNVYVAGLVTDGLAIIKYDQAGNKKWDVFTQGLESHTTHLALDDSANVYVARCDSHRGFVEKYTSAGEQLWSNAADSTIITALALDDSANIYVAGQTEWRYMATTKYDRNGKLRWKRPFRGREEEDNWGNAWDIVFDDSANVYVVGESGYYEDSYAPNAAAFVKPAHQTYHDFDFVTIKYNARGEEQWIARYTPGVNWDSAVGIGLDKFSNVYICGKHNNLFCTIKYDVAGSLQWVRCLDGKAARFTAAQALAVDYEGNIIVTGDNQGQIGDQDMATVKYNTNGEQLWRVDYAGPGRSYDEPAAMALDKDGNINITGGSWAIDSIATFDILTLRYDAGGNTVWNHRFKGARGYGYKPADIATDDSGNVFVSGHSYIDEEGSQYLQSYLVVKYNSAGQLLWMNHEPGNFFHLKRAIPKIALDSKGNSYLIGAIHRANNAADYVVAKYNAIGVKQWDVRYDGGGNDLAEAADIDESGNIYVSGVSGRAITTIKYDSNGQLIWAVRHEKNRDNRINVADLEVASSVSGEYVYLTGSIGYYGDYLTIKYDRAGNELWAKKFSSNPEPSHDVAQALIVDSWENIYVTGTTKTVKYDAFGNEAWVIPQSGYELALDGSGNLYLGEGFTDFVTVKYSSGGLEQWRAHYNSVGKVYDTLEDLQLDAHNNVYVMGRSWGDFDTGLESWFTTIKYIQTPVSVGEAQLAIVKRNTLYSNHPNPFNPSTTIRYALAQASRVSLKIYNLAGQEVATLVDDNKAAGEHEIKWTPAHLASGVYLYRLRAGDFVETKKLVLLQ